MASLLGTVRYVLLFLEAATAAVANVVETVEGWEIMSQSGVMPYTIDDEDEADSYLNAVLQKPEYRSMEEVIIRAQKYARNEHIKQYMIARGQVMLESLKA